MLKYNNHPLQSCSQPAGVKSNTKDGTNIHVRWKNLHTMRRLRSINAADRWGPITGLLEFLICFSLTFSCLWSSTFINSSMWLGWLIGTGFRLSPKAITIYLLTFVLKGRRKTLLKDMFHGNSLCVFPGGKVHHITYTSSRFPAM